MVCLNGYSVSGGQLTMGARRHAEEPDFLDELYEEFAQDDPDFPAQAELAYQQYALGRTLAKKRERLGLSQTAVARKMGSTQRIVSKIENGGDVQMSTLQRYARALGHDLRVRAVRRRQAVA